MREILFRGIIKSDNSRYKRGQWAVGDLVRLQDGNDGKPHIYGCGEVYAETIGQYTGLTDKNGKKIFEGDIVVTSIKGNKTVCKVAWADNVAQFQLWQFDTIPNTPTNLNLGNYDCEVIGNIHDNPELLKSEVDSE